MPRYKISGGIGIFKQNAANKKAKKSNSQTQVAMDDEVGESLGSVEKKEEDENEEAVMKQVKMEIEPVESKPTILNNNQWIEDTDVI